MSEPVKTDFSRTMELFQSLGYKIINYADVKFMPGPTEMALELKDNGWACLHFGDGCRPAEGDKPEFSAGYGAFGFCLCFDRETGAYLGHGAYE
jgi:hypothetical protein